MRHDETEVGVAKALVIIEGEMAPDSPAATISQRIKAGEAGMISVEVFEHLTQPNRLAILSAWQTRPDASEFAKSISPLLKAANLNTYVIRVIRDYGLKDRREAPQHHD